MPADTSRCGRVAILLSTYDGERFLPEQLESLLAQTHRDWTIRWRDDGSSDRSVAVMEAFAAGPAAGRCVRERAPGKRIGARASFLTLLGAEARCSSGGAEMVAFADQDDVWLPEKLARGYSALSQIPPGTPALYCARQVLVDAGLRPLGPSFRLKRSVGFPMALTQNIATGCTVMMNRAAARLVADTRAPPATVHDWWCYLVVSAAGGLLLVDDLPVVLYRQHGDNMVGAPSSGCRRAIAALRRGPAVFMEVFRQHVAALAAQASLLSPEACDDLTAIGAALTGGTLRRLSVLRLQGLRRQTWHETLLFRLWFVISAPK